LHQTQKDDQGILVCKCIPSVRTFCIRPIKILCSAVLCQIMHMV
jgi:hypothetical protein